MTELIFNQKNNTLFQWKFGSFLRSWNECSQLIADPQEVKQEKWKAQLSSFITNCITKLIVYHQYIWIS